LFCESKQNQRRDGIIVPIFCFKSASDYTERRNQVEIERPKKCPKCKKGNCFWAHGHYERQVTEDGKTVTISVPRFICSLCSQTVSVLFSFLIPYRRFTNVVSKAVQDYAAKKTTYRQEAEEVSVLDSPDPPKPSHTQVFRWVNVVAQRAESLLFLVQQELALKGKWHLITESDSQCPNAYKAWTVEKASALDKLAKLIDLAASLFSTKENVLERLHSYFLQNVDPLQYALANTNVGLSTPQSVKHVVF
jgi:hypothetical protein